MNMYDDRSAEADLNVVFAWQSGHRPLQRGITYGLDGAFPARLQPALLRAYEWASTRWHEFLHQPSKTALPVKASAKRGKPIRRGKRYLQEAEVPPSKRQASSAIDSAATVPVRTPITQGRTQDYTAWLLRGQENSNLGIQDYIRLNEQYKVLICLPCRAGVRPGKGVEGHFRTAHRLTGDLLKQIVLQT